MEHNERQEKNEKKERRDRKIEQHEIEEFEQKLRFALQHRAAPVGMKQRVLALARERRQKRHGWQWMMQRVTASLVLAAMVGGALVYHQVDERHKGEAAREQVMLALKITNKTLNRVNARLTDDDQ
ncbi:hypothetical protein [Acidicapsa ligni]|uniref:hypothetical protein n=1 Tax=Acidicapsa ligni TaxID=542300 RepID=UPI0021E06E27|nr:hypothetical protein [Acidicapsa ligni]